MSGLQSLNLIKIDKMKILRISLLIIMRISFFLEGGRREGRPHLQVEGFCPVWFTPASDYAGGMTSHQPQLHAHGRS